MLKFDNWKLTSDGKALIARQHDNLTARLEVAGDLPEGWAWSMLAQVGSALDILPMTPMEDGVGCTLTADQLSLSGFYHLQLRGTKGEEVKHTNIVSVYVPESLSGSGQWPAAPAKYMMVVTLSEAPEDSPLGYQASHSAEEIIAQLQRGWDAVLLVDIDEGGIQGKMELRPFGYTVLTEDGYKISVVIFTGSLLLADYTGAVAVVIDSVPDDGSENVKGAVEIALNSETIVNSVNGLTGDVTLTADDVGALSRNELQAGVDAALAQAKANGEFDGPTGPAGTAFIPTVDEETGVISWENDGGLENPAPVNIKGQQGAPFTYADFTEEQLAALEGPQGAPGKDNLPNVSAVTGTELTLTLDNNVEYQCAEAVTALTIEGFTPAGDGKVSMWAVQFTAGEGITVTLPDTVKWSVAEPVFTAGVTYWLSFVPLVSGTILGVWMSDE